jgi:ABC-2 type transport system permease protein
MSSPATTLTVAEGSNSFSLRRLFLVTQRVLNQLRHDKRFLAISLVAPIIVIVFLKILLDAMQGPGMVVSRLVVPIGGFLIHFFTYILCVLGLVHERSNETLSRMFVNGFKRTEIILGYMLAFTLLATLQSLVVILLLSWLFQLDYQFGTQVSIFLVNWLLAIISIALGILLSNFCRSEGQVIPTIPLVILPSAFLSGLLVPVDKLADWVQPISRISPLYYANNLLQALIKPNGNFGDDWGSLIALIAYGVIVLSLGSLTLKERD